MKVFSVWIGAALLRVIPLEILATFFLAAARGSIASATFTIAAREGARSLDSLKAAIAYAEPLPTASMVGANERKHEPFAKATISKVCKVPSLFGRFQVSHDVLRDVVVRARREFAAPYGLA